MYDYIKFQNSPHADVDKEWSFKTNDLGFNSFETFIVNDKSVLTFRDKIVEHTGWVFMWTESEDKRRSIICEAKFSSGLMVLFERIR